MNAYKLGLLHNIGIRLGRLLFILCAVAHVVLLLRLGQCVRNRSITYPLVLAGAAWGGIAAFLLINAFVQTASGIALNTLPSGNTL